MLYHSVNCSFMRKLASPAGVSALAHEPRLPCAEKDAQIRGVIAYKDAL